MDHENDTGDLELQGIAIIDTQAIDTICAQLDSNSSRNLLEDCFADLDQQIERFRQAGARGDWAGCLTTLHGLRGFAVDYGATVLSHEITLAKQALLSRDYQALAESIPRLSEAHRDTRSALMIRLAKWTASQVNHSDSS